METHVAAAARLATQHGKRNVTSIASCYISVGRTAVFLLIAQLIVSKIYNMQLPNGTVSFCESRLRLVWYNSRRYSRMCANDNTYKISFAETKFGEDCNLQYYWFNHETSRLYEALDIASCCMQSVHKITQIPGTQRLCTTKEIKVDGCRLIHNPNFNSTICMANLFSARNQSSFEKKGNQESSTDYAIDARNG